MGETSVAVMVGVPIIMMVMVMTGTAASVRGRNGTPDEAEQDLEDVADVVKVLLDKLVPRLVKAVP